MAKFRVLGSGDQREIQAQRAEVSPAHALILLDDNGYVVAAFATGHWTACISDGQPPATTGDGAHSGTPEHWMVFTLLSYLRGLSISSFARLMAEFREATVRMDGGDKSAMPQFTDRLWFEAVGRAGAIRGADST